MREEGAESGVEGRVNDSIVRGRIALALIGRGLCTLTVSKAGLMGLPTNLLLVLAILVILSVNLVLRSSGLEEDCGWLVSDEMGV